jgi:phosphoribosylformimino-5-aminoimidazole carboxamide ribotide isomerase
VLTAGVDAIDLKAPAAVPAKKIFAAGGVRGGEDLLALADCGISGALVAAVLHERRTGRARSPRSIPARRRRSGGLVSRRRTDA